MKQLAKTFLSEFQLQKLVCFQYSRVNKNRYMFSSLRWDFFLTIKSLYIDKKQQFSISVQNRCSCELTISRSRSKNLATCNMEISAKIRNVYELLTIVAKSFILDVSGFLEPLLISFCSMISCNICISNFSVF